MPSRPQFSTDDSVKIQDWYELKDIHKVHCDYAKDKGIERFPRKLLSRKVFKHVIDIDRFKKTCIVKIE